MAAAAATTPAKTHHKVVALETFLVPLPDDFADAFPPGHTFEVTSYPTSAAHEVAARLQDAEIVVSTIAPLRGAADGSSSSSSSSTSSTTNGTRSSSGSEAAGSLLPRDVDGHPAALASAASPHLRMIAVVAAGVDRIDVAACRARGIHVANSPACNHETVAEHALGSYFAVRRRFRVAHDAARTPAAAWVRTGGLHHATMALGGPDRNPDGRVGGPVFPLTCRSETLGIVGYGAVGRRVEALARALGMTVLVAARKGATAPLPAGRTALADVVRRASVLVLCLPRTPASLGLIGAAELAAMPRHAVLINVSRGGIVDEDALVAALRAHEIAGAATDVYLMEPASPETSPLLAADTDDLNLLTTPHVAWCSDTTMAAYNECLKRNIRSWLEGNPTNTVV
jgi:lactate dehydrogenase-like 2-hydroxyacid dehydrogenase